MPITIPMYEKGRSFVMAAGLVLGYQGHKFVYFHLLCQGFQNIGKALLLLQDYDKYRPLLLREVNKISDSDFFSVNASEEVFQLNDFYMNHSFRYGDDKSDFKDISFLHTDYLHRELIEHLGKLNQQFIENKMS